MEKELTEMEEEMLERAGWPEDSVDDVDSVDGFAADVRPAEMPEAAFEAAVEAIAAGGGVVVGSVLSDAEVVGGAQVLLDLDREEWTGAVSVIFYHASCADGYGAYVVANEALDEHFTTWGSPVQYGREREALEQLVADGLLECNVPVVFVVDFSFREAELAWFRERMPRTAVVILDHHATARKALAKYCLPERKTWAGLKEDGLVGGQVVARFEKSLSGVGLAWAFFFPDRPLPWFASYLQDRDLWHFELPESREFSHGVKMLGTVYTDWHRLMFGAEAQTIAQTGLAAVLFAAGRERKRTLEQEADDAWIESFGHDLHDPVGNFNGVQCGIRHEKWRNDMLDGVSLEVAHAVQIPAGNKDFSDWADYYLRRAYCSVVVGWFLQRGKMVLSLRSAKTHCGRLLEAYRAECGAESAGGHAAAAGMTVAFGLHLADFCEWVEVNMVRFPAEAEADADSD